MSPRVYPPLQEALRAQLQLVRPSHDRWLSYRPCSVVCRDGSHLDCVYLVDAPSYIRMWGVWPEDDSGKEAVRVEDVLELSESPFRLPAELANQVYQAGESGMGYCRFSVQFRGGAQQTYLTGNAVDFITAPPGLATGDAVSVTPHGGTNQDYVPGLKYAWCLFQQAPDTA